MLFVYKCLIIILWIIADDSDNNNRNRTLSPSEGVVSDSESSEEEQLSKVSHFVLRLLPKRNLKICLMVTFYLSF